MYLLRNNKLEQVSLSEDDYCGHNTAVLTKETSAERRAAESKTPHDMVRDKIYTMEYTDGKGYIFRVTQSPWSDNSGMSNGLDVYHRSIGDCVYSAMKYGYTVYNKDQQIEPPTGMRLILSLLATY